MESQDNDMELKKSQDEIAALKGARAPPTQLFSRVAMGHFSVTTAAILLKQELY